MLKQHQCAIHKISDGDTLSVLPKGSVADELRERFGHRERLNLDRPLRVRLFGVDALELDQPGGQQAHERLVQLLAPYESDGLAIALRDIDYWGRAVGEIWCDGLSLAPQLLAEGNTVIYRKYLRPLEESEPDFYAAYTAAENSARQYKLGFWSLPDPERMAPCEWRRQKREKGDG